MSSVFEKMSQELTLELYELKIKYKFAEQKIQEQNEKIIEITNSCIMLEAENVFLKRQVQEYSTPTASRQLQSICTPFKNSQDDNSTSSRGSENGEHWSVVKPPRKLKYSEGTADSTNSESLRIHVSHLNPTTTEKSLREYFSQYGIVDDVFHRSPRFAYVSFRSFYGDSPLASSEHFIDGKRVVLETAKKFVAGGLSSELLITPATVSDEKLLKHFSQYGKINGITRPQCPLIFAFISFDSPQCIDKAFVDDHVIDGVEIRIRRMREFYEKKPKASKEQNKTCTILVSAEPDIMKKLNVNDLKTFFSIFGKVASVRKPTIKNEVSHYAFVQFASFESAEKATDEKYHEIKGHKVNVSKSNSS